MRIVFGKWCLARCVLFALHSSGHTLSMTEGLLEYMKQNNLKATYLNAYEVIVLDKWLMIICLISITF